MFPAVARLLLSVKARILLEVSLYAVRVGVTGTEVIRYPSLFFLFITIDKEIR